MVERIQAHFDQYGFGLYAVQRREDARFLGFVGLQWVPFEAHFTPAIEIGWRLARHAWGAGYASEAAQAVLQHAFDVLNLEEVVSFTVPANARSISVMEKIGLTHDPAADFIHPRPGLGDLAQHVFYRGRRATWKRPTGSRERG